MSSFTDLGSTEIRHQGAPHHEPQDEDRSSGPHRRTRNRRNDSCFRSQRKRQHRRRRRRRNADHGWQGSQDRVDLRPSGPDRQHADRPADEVTDRITKLEAASATATSNGKTQRADRINARVDLLKARLDKIDNRITKAPQWIAKHCTAGSTTTGGTGGTGDSTTTTDSTTATTAG